MLMVDLIVVVMYWLRLTNCTYDPDIRHSRVVILSEHCPFLGKCGDAHGSHQILWAILTCVVRCCTCAGSRNMTIFDLAVNDDGCCIDCIDGGAYDCFDMHCGSSFDLADCGDVHLNWYKAHYSLVYFCRWQWSYHDARVAAASQDDVSPADVASVHRQRCHRPCCRGSVFFETTAQIPVHQPITANLNYANSKK